MKILIAAASTWSYAAKNPGRWANKLKVCTIDAFADQVITITSTTHVVVGMGVTQSLDGKTMMQDRNNFST